ncbi:PREDICTED: ankyrin-3-like isoform X3 [Acropora digitifera]|uniref:ankyrin-3-like isoform X3 n=1 Tax=Acropora digitifera TaxID=70779 RepID=UPI000779F837|nr:PREDICTED: ankyrin-3-like isoform X3 [Acropora digitifera]
MVYGMDSKMGKIQRSEQQLPSVSSDTFVEPHSAHKSKITEEERALATHENKKDLEEYGENLIKLLISARDLNEDQSKAFHTILSVQVKTYVEVHHHSTDRLKEVGALNKFITENYRLLFKYAVVGSLVIVLNCQRIESLEHLWNDFLSGHLDKVAERYLVTDEMKRRLNLETINLKTTIEEENYLNCRKVLMDCSGEAERTLFSQQGVLDQEASMIEKATVGSEEEASRSALHKAAVNGQYEEVKRHLSSGCAVDVKDQFLLTPLHLACWYGQESVVQLLLQHGADVNATDKFQFTPLHKAERRNHHSIVKLLMEHKAIPTLQQPLSLRTLGRRAFTRTDEHSGYNLLQAAILEGDDNTVEKVSNHLENFVEEMKNLTGEKACKIYKEFVETDVALTELHSCAKRNDVEMAIEIVVNYGIDVNVASKRNITPLLWASPVASSLSIKTLIDLGADLNAQTFEVSTFSWCRGTALHSAIHGNNAAVVKVLLANKADANIADQEGNTVLHISTCKEFCNISQLLLDSGCKINGRNNRGETPLHSAVRGNNVVDVELLLKNNADANLHDASGDTPLHISMRDGFSKISQLLIDSGCKLNERNKKGETPLYSAISGKNRADVQLLLKNNADTNNRDTFMNTPLHISARCGSSNISQLLINFGCKINGRGNWDDAPLHTAVNFKNVGDVDLLLKNNADANLEDASGNTPLHISTRKGFPKISQLLIDSGCKIDGRNRMGETPLCYAVRGGNVADVELLLVRKNNVDANIRDNDGNTPLHISTREGLYDISQLLIDSGCEINGRNNRGETPLHSAVLGNNVAGVELLLRNNADVNIHDKDGNTALHISTVSGFSNISQLLAEAPPYSTAHGENVADVRLSVESSSQGKTSRVGRSGRDLRNCELL